MKNLDLHNRAYNIYANSNNWEKCLLAIVGCELADILSQRITEELNRRTQKELRELIKELKRIDEENN